MDERALTERLITYDTSNVDGLRAAAGFIKGWLEAREIDVVDHKFGDLHALSAVVGPPEGAERATLVFHGHFDVVPVGDGWTVDPFGGELRDALKAEARRRLASGRFFGHVAYASCQAMRPAA